MLLIPCYYNENNHMLSGRNIIYDFLLEWFALPLETCIIYIIMNIDFTYEPTYYFKLKGKIEYGNK
jgi:hypothetical protein